MEAGCGAFSEISARHTNVHEFENIKEGEQPPLDADKLLELTRVMTNARKSLKSSEDPQADSPYRA